MISEKKFSRSFGPFWMMHLPFFSDYYSSSAVLGEKIHPHIETIETADMRGLTNIIAFIHYKALLQNPSTPVSESIDNAYPIVRYFYRKYHEDTVIRYIHGSDEINQIVQEQALNIINRYPNKVVTDPFFPGYGFMPNCRGDLLVGDSLVEIKAGLYSSIRKPFNPEDFRQLLIYLALNHASDQPYPIKKIELYNPRSGMLWKSPIDEFINIIANKSPIELYQIILFEFENRYDSFNN